MRKHEFKTPILFGDYYKPSEVKMPSHVGDGHQRRQSGEQHYRDVDGRTGKESMERVQAGLQRDDGRADAEQDDDEDEAVDHWCRVFGDDFRKLSEEEE